MNSTVGTQLLSTQLFVNRLLSTATLMCDSTRISGVPNVSHSLHQYWKLWTTGILLHANLVPQLVCPLITTLRLQKSRFACSGLINKHTTNTYSKTYPVLPCAAETILFLKTVTGICAADQLPRRIALCPRTPIHGKNRGNHSVKCTAIAYIFLLSRAGHGHVYLVSVLPFCCDL